MSYAIFRRRPRAVLAAGSVCLGLLAATGCERPTPLVTATVGGSSVSTEAACYHGGKPLKRAELTRCLARKPARTVELGPGDRLRIGVEPGTAKAGWTVLADGTPTLPEPIHKTYYSFSGDAFLQQASPRRPGAARMKESATVTVLQTGSGNGPVRGVWHVELKSAG